MKNEHQASRQRLLAIEKLERVSNMLQQKKQEFDHIIKEAQPVAKELGYRIQPEDGKLVPLTLKK